jgi:hypothetical protein
MQCFGGVQVTWLCAVAVERPKRWRLTVAAVNVILFSRPANKFHLSACRRLEKLRNTTEWVEEEIRWTQYQAQKTLQMTQHEEVLGLLQRRDAPIMGPQLSYRDLPHDRNTQFHFREDVLTRLRTFFAPGQRQSLKSASICGLGGIGKTQLALEFAYRHIDAYDAIFWIPSESEIKVREAIITYVRTMDGSDLLDSHPDVVLLKMFQKWLMTARIEGQ